MVTVANCYDVYEAFRLQMALEAADVPSFIPDEATAQTLPYLFFGSGQGVRVQVAEEHASEAQRIISNAREEFRNQDEEREECVRPNGAAMDKKPEAPRLIKHISSAGLLLGFLAIVVGGFWRVVGPWLMSVGILILIIAFSLLASYRHPS
jgi:hypothetical protein